MHEKTWIFYKSKLIIFKRYKFTYTMPVHVTLVLLVNKNALMPSHDKQ